MRQNPAGTNQIAVFVLRNHALREIEYLRVKARIALLIIFGVALSQRCILARAQALRCSTRQAVGRRRSGSRFCSPIVALRKTETRRLCTLIAWPTAFHSEATGKVRELAASSYEPQGSADWKDTLLRAESLVRRITDS